MLAMSTESLREVCDHFSEAVDRVERDREGDVVRGIDAVRSPRV